MSAAARPLRRQCSVPLGGPSPDTDSPGGCSRLARGRTSWSGAVCKTARSARVHQ